MLSTIEILFLTLLFLSLPCPTLGFLYKFTATDTILFVSSSWGTYEAPAWPHFNRCHPVPTSWNAVTPRGYHYPDRSPPSPSSKPIFAVQPTFNPPSPVPKAIAFYWSPDETCTFTDLRVVMRLDPDWRGTQGYIPSVKELRLWKAIGPNDPEWRIIEATGLEEGHVVERDPNAMWFLADNEVIKGPRLAVAGDPDDEFAFERKVVNLQKIGKEEETPFVTAPDGEDDEWDGMPVLLKKGRTGWSAGDKKVGPWKEITDLPTLRREVNFDWQDLPPDELRSPTFGESPDKLLPHFGGSSREVPSKPEISIKPDPIEKLFEDTPLEMDTDSDWCDFGQPDQAQGPGLMKSLSTEMAERINNRCAIF